MTFTDQELTAEQWLRSIWAALSRMEELLSRPRVQLPDQLPPPPVEIDHDRLAQSVVAMLTQLHPTGPTANELADALAQVFPRTEEVPQEGARALEQVAQALKDLDFRLKGMGTQAYGGGSVSLLPNQSVNVANQLVPTAYDRIDLTYTGDDVTGVVYLLDGVVVATLTLTYTGENLTSVVRS